MVNIPNKNSPEWIIFYLDLASKTLSKKDILKALTIFAQEKVKKNTSVTYSAFYFKDNEAPDLSPEDADMSKILRQIELDWKHRESRESRFENGLFYCLSFLAEKAIQSEGTFRIIVISDIPSSKSSDYTEALMNLVETVRSFPTFIDIIRIGKSDFYGDEVKLRIISTITAGGLFYNSNSKEFKKTLEGLVKNKALPDLMVGGGQAIEKDQRMYYDNIAKELIDPTSHEAVSCHICQKEICDYCNAPEDLIKVCPKCQTGYHECCSALHAWKNNIGLKYIFRCPSCGTMLKLDEDFVHEINGEPLEKETLSKQELEETLATEETWVPEPEEVQEEVKDEVQTFKAEVAPEPEQPVKINGNGARPSYGLFGPDYSKMKGKKKKPPKTVKPLSDDEETKRKKAAEAKLRLQQRRKRHQDVRVCPVCSNAVKPGQRVCTKCGQPL